MDGSTGRQDLVHRENVELDRVYLAWPSPRHFACDDAPLTILADILARGRSSRLYRKLVVEDQVAQDVSAYQSSRELAGTFGVVATLRPGREPSRAVELILAEIDGISAGGITAEELARVKNGRLASFLYALDNVGGFGGVADRLNAYNTYLGDPGQITGDFARYEETTAYAVASAASRHLTDSRGAIEPRVVLTVLGRRPPVVVPPLDRMVKPGPAPASPFRPPTPTALRLSCGVPLWVIPRRDLPIVAATVVLRAGASAHGPEVAGLASLTSDLMDEGTTTRDAETLAMAAESLGTHLSASCGWDGSYVGVQCLAPHRVASLDLWADVLRNPTFPQPEFDRLRAQLVAGLKATRDSAEQVAHRAFLPAIYPSTHAYSIPTEGDEASVGGLTRDMLAEFHGLNYRPDRAAIVVAGDVDPEKVAREIDDLLKGWTGEGPSAREFAPTALPERPRILLIDRPGAPQAVVRVGHVGPSRTDPDHDALMVFNQILGGQFTSRLNAKLREEKAFTYGVRSHFDGRRGPGPFAISASLQADRLAEALDDLRAETFALLGERPPTLAEIDDARRALIEGQARHFETPSALVARYAGLFLHGLPLDYHATLAARLSGLTAHDLKAAADRHLRPESFAYVVVADASAVSGPLVSLGWADVSAT